MVGRVAVLAFLPFAGLTATAQLPPMPGDTAEETGKRPRLFVAQPFRNIGEMVEGEKRMVTWILENKGSADLVLEKTKSSCGCAVVKLNDEDRVIPPGKSLELKTEFDSNMRRGTQAKNVVVYTNDPSEPQFKLEFKAEVKALYDVNPPGLVNLRAVQRGEVVSRTVDFTPAADHQSVDVISVEVHEGSPINHTVEPIKGHGGSGGRIRFAIPEDAALGTLSANLKVKLKIDALERERYIPVRAEIVGDLTWQPKVIDVTRQTSTHGKRLAPVMIRSADKRPFEILEASAGPWLEATFEPVEGVAPGTKYRCYVTVRDNAPAGPFGAMLEVRTDVLDQPVVQVPVYGIVAPVIRVEPPVILLRQDGTAVGERRLLKLQASPREELEITEIVCPNRAVRAAVNRERSARYRHLRYLDVYLEGKLPKGTHQTVLSVTTGVVGAARLEIPVVIRVP